MRRKTASLMAMVFGLGVGQAAWAADMPTKAPIYKAPMMAPAYNWTGWYVGVYGGGAWGSLNATASDPFSSAPPFIGGYNLAPDLSYRLNASLLAGGTLGYNYQTGHLVIGPEAEFGYLRVRGSASFVGPFAGASELTATSTAGDWYGALTGRLGYASNDWLIYGKAGVAAVRQKASLIDATASAGNPGLLDAEGSRTTWGLALGSGVEWAFAHNWTVKAEYLYLSVNHNVFACGIDTGAGSAGFGATFCSNVSFPAIHTAKIGINYLFH